MEFHIRLKQLRQLKQVTQGELANILGVKASTIANYESNRNEPNFDKLVAIAKFFCVSVDFLLGITEDCHCCVIKSLDNENYELYQSYKKLKSHDMEKLQDYIDYLLYKRTINNV